MEKEIKELLEFASHCPAVSQIKNQITEKQAAELLKQFPLTALKKQLNAMENRQDLMKKYSSVYLTILRWFEIDIRKGFYKPEPIKNIATVFISERKEFMKVHPIGSLVQIGNFTYEVIDESGLFSDDNNSYLPIDTAISLINSNQTRRQHATKASNN